MSSWHTARWWSTWVLGGAAAWLVGFMLAFMLIAGAMSLLVDDVDAAMEGAFAFAIALTLVFAAGGACMGLVHWLHLRRRTRRAGRWIAVMAGMFALISITYNLLVWAAGEAHLDTTSGRLANEMAHTIVVGIVIAAVSWMHVGRVNGGGRDRWLLLVGLSVPATGLTIWGLEVLLDATGGDVNPLGMLVMGAMLGAAWRPLLQVREGAAHQTSAGVPV